MHWPLPARGTPAFHPIALTPPGTIHTLFLKYVLASENLKKHFTRWVNIDVR